MAYNSIKLGAATLLALACIVAPILDADQNYVWAAPVLGILVGYVAMLSAHAQSEVERRVSSTSIERDADRSTQ